MKRAGADRRSKLKQAAPKYANWCRVRGHPPQCRCEYEKPQPEWAVEHEKQLAAKRRQRHVERQDA